MRNLFTVLALAVSSFTTNVIYAESAIDFPYYQSHNNTRLDIRRVESNDDGVTVYADLYSRPDSWVRIAQGAYIKGVRSGRVCPVLSSEGLKLGAEVYPDQSGRIPFVMKFGPLSSDDDSFDFYEGDAPGDFWVKGISMDMPLSDGAVTCHLEGEVSDPHVSRLIVIENDEDLRTVSHFISIPVTDGRFSYDFHADNEKYYCLSPFNEYLNGSWRNGRFFAYDGTVNFIIPDRDEMIVVTSEMPEQKIAMAVADIRSSHSAVVDSLANTLTSENIYSAEGRALNDRINHSQGDERKALIEQLNSGDYYSDIYKSYRAMVDSISPIVLQEEIKFFTTKPSLYAIVQTYERLNSRMKGEWKDLYNQLYDSVLVNYRPDYYFHDKINAMRRADLLQPGKPYIDYYVTDSDGSKIEISKLIEGKVTLVDLWASWCGPCRVLSMSYIPVYEKYKDAGFNVIGIAREQNKAFMEATVRTDGYPWKNYLELNDENRIWELNGIGNSGGTSFLLSKDGKIIMAQPTAEELEQILEILKSQGKL